MSSNEYLTRVNLMDAASEDSDTPIAFGKNVAVIGGVDRGGPDVGVIPQNLHQIPGRPLRQMTGEVVLLQPVIVHSTAVAEDTGGVDADLPGEAAGIVHGAAGGDGKMSALLHEAGYCLPVALRDTLAADPQCAVDITEQIDVG